MEKHNRAELIALVAGLASQANKLLAMVLADPGVVGEQTSDIVPVIPKKDVRKSGVNTEREIMKMVEAAAFTGYSKGYLYRLVGSGELPRRGREGGHLYFKRSDLEELMLRKTRSTNSEIDDTATAILNKDTTHI